MSTAGWRKYSVRKFLRAIDGSGGNITVVCKRVGCKRETFIKAMNEHPAIRSALSEAEEEFGDLVESKIAQKIKEGNVVMTIFYAKTKLKKRGYVEAQILHEGQPVPMLVDDIPDTPPDNPGQSAGREAGGG